MTETDTPRTQNQTVVYALAAIVVLLVAVVVVIVVRGNTTSVSDSLPPATAPQTGAPAVDPAAGAPAAGAPATPIKVDPNAATKVPKGTDPADFTKGYYEALLAKDYEKAFKMQPADKQAGGDVAGFKGQIEGYGVTGYNIVSSDVQGDAATVVVDQVTANYGTFTNAWTFTKTGDTWFVAAKQVTGMK